MKIPTKLLNVSNNNKEAQERLKATYSLINENSKISSKEIEQKLTDIRKVYLRPIGNQLGNVILIKNKEDFLSDIAELEKMIEKFSKEVRKYLEKELEKSKKELSKILLPGVKKNPPDDLKKGIVTPKPDRETALKYLNNELEKVIPTIDSLLNDIHLKYYFKDVTYEMLKDKDFQENLRKQFPYVPWPKPFEEHEAIQEKDPKQLVLL